MNVGLIHYSYPPVVGGVEFVMQGQARQFARHGHKVRVIAGNAARAENNIRCVSIPALRAGKSPKSPNPQALLRRLRPLVRDLDLVLVHNVMTMHFNVALTAALWKLAIETRRRTRWIFWTHDLCLLNPDYPGLDATQLPHSLLRKRHPTASYVAVSEMRRRELASLLEIPRSHVRVVADAIDIPAMLDLDPDVWDFFLQKNLAQQDVVLFFPTRVLPRKNLEGAIELIGRIRRLGKKVTLLMTGAPDPHNPAAVRYFRRICALIRQRRLQKCVIFTNRHFAVGFRQLLSLYRLCDAVLMSSKQEGFGLPLLEGGVHGKPIICPGREPFTEVMDGRAMDVLKAPAIVRFLEHNAATGHFKRVLREYGWEAVWSRHLSKL